MGKLSEEERDKSREQLFDQLIDNPHISDSEREGFREAREKYREKRRWRGLKPLWFIFTLGCSITAGVIMFKFSYLSKLGTPIAEPQFWVSIPVLILALFFFLLWIR